MCSHLEYKNHSPSLSQFPRGEKWEGRGGREGGELGGRGGVHLKLGGCVEAFRSCANPLGTGRQEEGITMEVR